MTSPNAVFLLLDVAGTSCAVRREEVREILPLPHLHQPPASGGPLAGFADIGGDAVPVLDLAVLLGLRGQAPALDPYRHLVMMRDGRLALLVDRVSDLFAVPDTEIVPVADGLSLNGCVEAEIARADGLVHVLSLPRLLTAEERQRVRMLADKAEARLSALDAAIVTG